MTLPLDFLWPVSWKLLSICIHEELFIAISRYKRNVQISSCHLNTLRTVDYDIYTSQSVWGDCVRPLLWSKL